ncbi:MAG: type II CAAX endopeptidase family protein [Haloferacaceae archaeon]|nr:type II CAAX endopeptidase family protein [Haloferacaceae archaeon]
MTARAIARTLVVAVGLAVVGVGAGLLLVLGVLFIAAAAGVEMTPLRTIAVSLVFATGLGFGGVALMYLRLRGLSVAYVGLARPSRTDALAVGAGYVSALLLVGAAGAVLMRTDTEAAPNTAAQAGLADPSVLVLLLVASLVIIGPGEELLFRGIVQRRLREALPAVAAIPLASIIFAAIHYLSLAGAPEARVVSISVLVLPTLVFGVVYELTENLVVPALTHGLYNATLFGLLYLTVTVDLPM